MCAILWCRRTAPSLVVGQKQCFACGVLRPSIWYYASDNGRARLSARCRPCSSLYTRRKRDQRSLASEDMLVEKLCLNCGDTLPIGRFSTSSSHKDGSQSKCKGCMNTESAARYAKRIQRGKTSNLVVAVGQERVCSMCGVCKPWEGFKKRVANNIGLEAKCKQCQTDSGKLRYTATKAK